MNRKKKLSYQRDNTYPVWKIFFSACMVLVLFISVGYKAADLQLLNRDKAFELAKRQHNNSYRLLPKRGNILDRNSRRLATSVNRFSIYVNPRQISSPHHFAETLSGTTNISYEEALSFALSDRSFLWLKRLAEPELVEGIRKMNLEGIGFIEEPRRTYPNGHLLGQVLGFTNIDSTGIEGIEYMLDGILRGNPREIHIRRDARGKPILNASLDIDESTSGFDVYLTIDSQIQHIVEKELEKGVREFGAKSAMAVLMKPDTGEILAMASYPFFNPNRFRDFNDITMRNRPVWYTFEPGSTTKAFLLAAALEEKIANPDTKYDCENGRRKVGPTVIRDIRPHDILTVAETITESSNICASKIGETLGRKSYHDYLSNFGFGKRTGIDLPGEQSGLLPGQNRWGPVELATISFGQGVAVTSLQLATAISAVANGGYLMKPYILHKIVSPNGDIVREKRPQVANRVISFDTALKVSDILEQAVENGTGKMAMIPEYRVAGKTGTAQIPDPAGGGYYKNSYMASFIGFAPADNPEISLVVVVEDPKEKIYGGAVAAPIFREIAEKVLFMMDVPASRDFMGNRVMPNMNGRSAREIMRWAEEAGVEVELRGSGYSVEQTPEPGELIKRGTLCSFKLKQDI